MDTISLIMDLAAIGIGAYAFYTIYLMQSTGEIKKELLLNKYVDLKKCKDKKGYIAHITPRLAIFGIAITLYGIVGVVLCFLQDILQGWTSMVPIIVFLIVAIWFLRETKKAYEMFWR